LARPGSRIRQIDYPVVPRVRIDATGCAAAGQAGDLLLTDTIRTAGLDRERSQSLARWRKPATVHDPAQVVLGEAESLAFAR